MHVLNYKIVTGSLLVYKLQSRHPKNQKQITHESNWLCMLQTRRKSRSVKKNKNNFIDITGDKFAMSIRGGNLIISFCKKRFSCRNIFSYLHK